MKRPNAGKTESWKDKESKKSKRRKAESRQERKSKKGKEKKAGKRLKVDEQKQNKSIKSVHTFGPHVHRARVAGGLAVEGSVDTSCGNC